MNTADARSTPAMQGALNILRIKEDEREQIAYLGALLVLIGIGFALGRGVADALFLKRYGIAYLPVMYVLLGIALAVAGIAYAAYADRFPAERLFRILLYTLLTLVMACWVLMSFTTWEWVYPFFFVLYELASELLWLHVGIYMIQNFDTLQLQRLSPLLFAAAQIGKIAGGTLLASVAPFLPLKNLLPLWALLVGLSTVAIYRWHKRAGISPHYHAVQKNRSGLRHSVTQLAYGLKFLRRSDLARAACYALFFMAASFSLLSYSINRVYTEAFTSEAALGAFFGWLTALTGVAALLIQLLLTGRLFQWFGVKRMHLVYPVASIVSYAALLGAYALPAALIGSLTKDVLNPALSRPTRNLILNALPSYMQGRVRALSVALVTPMALIVTGGMLIAMQHLRDPTFFLLAGLAASGWYLYFNLCVNRFYVSTLLATLRDRVFIPDADADALLKGGGQAVIAELQRGVMHPDPGIALPYARMLIAVSSEPGCEEIIIARLNHADAALRDQLVRLLIALDRCPNALLWELLPVADLHLRATLLSELFERKDTRARSLLRACLAADNPRLIGAGIRGAFAYAEADDIARAQTAWNQLLISVRDADNIAGIEMLAHHPRTLPVATLVRFLRLSSPRVCIAALRTLPSIPAATLAVIAPHLRPVFYSGEPEIRAACVACFGALPAHERDRLLLAALGDPHPAVRTAAMRTLNQDDAPFVSALFERLIENTLPLRAQAAALSVIARLRPARADFERIAEAKAQEAFVLAYAVSVLHHQAHTEGSPAPPTALLEIVLREHLEQTLDLALTATKHLQNRVDIAIIRAAFLSHDRRHIAQAVEALRYLEHRKLAALFGVILGDPATTIARHPKGNEVFVSRLDVLIWCRRHPAAWIRACAVRALGTPLALGA